jgi:YidC/Oxa1 family membrane protein insertase
MPSWLSSLLSPFTYPVSAALAGAHRLVTGSGLDPASGLAWAASISMLVVAVRLVLLPVVVHHVRLSRAGGRGWLPLLLQTPVMFALFRVLMDVAAGVSTGLMTSSLVHSARGAQVFGAGLWQSLSQVGDPGAAAVAAVLVALTGAVTYAGNRFLTLANVPTHALDGPAGQAQRLMPALGAAVVAASGIAVPLGIVLYWLVGALWTAGQQFAINRWAPTPGSPADAARRTRQAGRRPARG